MKEKPIVTQKKHESVTIWLGKTDIEKFENAGITDRSGKNLKHLLLEGIASMHIEEYQLLEDCLWLIEQNMSKFKSVKMEIVSAVTHRKQHRRLCDVCGKRIAVKHGLCADCVPDREPMDICSFIKDRIPF